MMPQQMVGPAPGIAGSIHVLAAEEIGLHVHLLDRQLAFLDALVNPLVAGIEAAHVPAHRDHAGLLGDPHQALGILDAVGYRNLDQHVLARTHDLLALAEVHLRRRGEDHRVGALDAFREITRMMRDAVFSGDLGSRILIAPNEGSDLHFGNALERVEMLLAEGPLAGNANLHRVPCRAIR